MISHAKEMTLHNFKAFLRLNMTFWSILVALSVTEALMTWWFFGKTHPTLFVRFRFWLSEMKPRNHIEKVVFFRCVSRTLFVLTRWFEGSWKRNKKMKSGSLSLEVTHYYVSDSLFSERWCSMQSYSEENHRRSKIHFNESREISVQLSLKKLSNRLVMTSYQKMSDRKFFESLKMTESHLTFFIRSIFGYFEKLKKSAIFWYVILSLVSV